MKQILATLVLSVVLLGQSGSDSADLGGTVLDPAGGSVPVAGLVLKNEQTGLEKRTESDSAGGYRLFLIPPGVYELRVAKTGFKTQLVKDIRLTVGQAAILDVRLELGETAAVIEVRGEPGLVESERSSQANTLQQE